MKTASIHELPAQCASIVTWLHEGDTIVLTNDGERLGRIIPERQESAPASADRRALFAQRFAPLGGVPQRDLSRIVQENRGAQ